MGEKCYSRRNSSCKGPGVGGRIEHSNNWKKAVVVRGWRWGGGFWEARLKPRKAKPRDDIFL